MRKPRCPIALREDKMKKLLVALVAVAFASGAHAQGLEKIKLGFVTALSGALGLPGAEQKRGLDVALEHLDNKIGGLPVELITGDSKTNPQATVQELSRLIEKDRVDVVVGLTGSNEILAAMKPISDAKIFFIGANGGPAQLAGEGCIPYYFNASFQNEQLTEGIGEHMFKQGIKKLYVMGMDYEAGHEHSNAARIGYKGEVVAHVFTPINQVDFASDIAKIRASGADGVWAFYPGGPGISFTRQWAQAGLQNKIPLFSNVALSEPLVFAAQGKTALGITVTGVYFAAIDNPENKRFVETFRTKFSRDPASYAAMAYDSIMLLDSAVREVKGNLSNQEAFRAALKKANFKSVRGPFKFNNNQQPIQNTYAGVVEQRDDGSLYIKPTGTIQEMRGDSFASKCQMK
jgi:branched-chain amino acid transport system substrate-binding protein